MHRFQLPVLPKIACLAVGLSLNAFALEPPPSASELAAQLSEKQQDGTSYVRLKMDISGPKKAVLQLQIKSRAGKNGTDLVYQVLWPKERKGESVLLRRSSNRSVSGTLFTPPDQTRPLESAHLRDAFFGSDLSYEDVIENFYAWDEQALVGTETVDRVPCQILESKPGKSGHSVYGSVRTWVDTRRLVPLRIEKYNSAGRLVRRIETTRVVTDDKGRPLPANLTVRGPGGESVTELDGSKIKHGVSYTEDEFTPEGLKKMSVPRGSPE